MAHIHSIYRQVEIRHPEYPADAEPLIAKIRRNLTNAQLNAIPKVVGTDPETGKPYTTTTAEVWEAIYPYVIEWNWEAETDDGSFAPVPPPSIGGVDVFRTMDDFFTLELYFHVRYAAYGGPPGSKEEADRKNSSAASDDSVTTSDAGDTSSTSNVTDISNRLSVSETDSTNTDTKPTAGSRKRKTS